MIPREELERDLLVVACAISAGIHAALAPGHGAAAGLGFVSAAALLAAVVVALTVRPASALPVAGAAIVLSGLLGSYALALATGVPLLHPDREAVDALAVATKLVEAAGLVTAISALRRTQSVSLPTIDPRGSLT